MHLTGPLPLLPSYTDQDVLDSAHVLASASTSSAIAALRFGAVPKDEQVEFFRGVIADALANAARFPRIRDRPDGQRPGDAHDTDRYETLAVRDLDLPPVDTSTHGSPPDPPTHQGRIVSYIALRYNSRRPSQPQHPASQPTPPPPPRPPFPPSGHPALHAHFGQQVETALHHTFSPAPCYEVLELATLSPSHLRRGTARALLGWMLERADLEMLPVVLAGSPAGVPLYRAVGFEEVGGRDPGWTGEGERWGGEGEGAVRVNLEDWGGEGVHRHLLMVRFPRGWVGRRDWWGYVQDLRADNKGEE